MNEWTRIAVNTHQLVVEGGVLIRYRKNGAVAMVFVPAIEAA